MHEPQETSLVSMPSDVPSGYSLEEPITCIPGRNSEEEGDITKPQPGNSDPSQPLDDLPDDLNIPDPISVPKWWKHEADTKAQRISWHVIVFLNTMRNVPNSYFKLAGFEEQGILRLGNVGIGLFMVILFTRTVLISAASMNEGRSDVNKLNRLASALQAKVEELKQIRRDQLKWNSLTLDQKNLLEWLYCEKPEKLKQIFPDYPKEENQATNLKADDIYQILGLDVPKLMQTKKETEEEFEKRKERHEIKQIKCLRVVLQAAMRSRAERWFANFIYFALIINALVYSLFAAKSCYTFVIFLAVLAGTSAASMGAIIPAILVATLFFIVTMVASCYLTGNDIERDCMTFYDFWTLPVKFEWKHVVYLLASVTTIATAALMFNTLSTTLVPLLIVAGCNPIGALIVAAILVIITVIGSVKFLCSAVRGIREEFKDKLWRNSDVYQNYEKQKKEWLYWTMVGVGAVFSAAVILVGILGDVFGISKLIIITEENYIKAVVMSVVAVLSFFCNLLQNVDFLHRFPSTMEIFCLKSQDKTETTSELASPLQNKGLFALPLESPPTTTPPDSPYSSESGDESIREDNLVTEPVFI